MSKRKKWAKRQALGLVAGHNTNYSAQGYQLTIFEMGSTWIVRGNKFSKQGASDAVARVVLPGDDLTAAMAAVVTGLRLTT